MGKRIKAIGAAAAITVAGVGASALSEHAEASTSAMAYGCQVLGGRWSGTGCINGHRSRVGQCAIGEAAFYGLDPNSAYLLCYYMASVA